jgi:hypothetical protein
LTARELADDLDCFLDDMPIKARPIGMWERLGKWGRKHPAQAVAAVGSLMALVGFVLMLVAFV